MSTTLDSLASPELAEGQSPPPVAAQAEVVDRRKPAPGPGQPGFVDRRQSSGSTPGVERRQFGNTHYGLSPAARELAEAIDNYKLQHRRRYVTYEEMLQVITRLGYAKK